MSVFSKLAAWLGTKTAYLATGKGAGVDTIALPLGGYLDCTGLLTNDVDIQVAAPAEGTTVKVANRTTAAGGANGGHSNILSFHGLWIEPGGIQECVYLGAAWRYSVGSGGAYVFKVRLTSAAVAGTVATVLAKIPAKFQTRDFIETSFTAPVGGTVTNRVSSPTLAQDIQADHATGAANTYVQDTGSALLNGLIYPPSPLGAAYSLTQSSVVSAPLGTAAVVDYTITVFDAS